MLRARHRVLLITLGLAACAAGALQLPATASSAASETTHTPATAQLSVRQLTALSPQAIGALQQPLLTVANKIIQLTDQGLAPGYSGYGDVTISVPKHLVTLYWHGSVPSALRLRLASMDATAPVQVVAAPYTWQQLEAQTHQVSADRASLSAEGYTIASVGPTAAATGLQVGVDYATSHALATMRPNATQAATAVADAASARAAVQHLVPGPAPVSVTDVPVAHATGSRQSDTWPWWGGARIVRPGNIVCSTGFSVKKGSTLYMLTAGHCGGISTSWQTGDSYGAGTAIGTEVNRAPCCDTAIIQVTANQGWIYDKGWNSTVGEHVIGYKTAVVGTMICDEGATAGVLCNLSTDATGQVVTFDGDASAPSFTAENESEGFNLNEDPAVAGGDSGGPTIINSGTSGQVYAAGTISGGFGEVSCGSIDPNVVPVCYEGSWFEAIVPILNYWGVSMVG